MSQDIKTYKSWSTWRLRNMPKAKLSLKPKLFSIIICMRIVYSFITQLTL